MLTFVSEVVMSDQWLKEWNLELETIRAFELACMGYAAALMRVTLGFPGFYLQDRFQNYLGQSQEFQKGANDGSVLTEDSSWIRAAMVAGKKMLPNTQSIKGL